VSLTAVDDALAGPGLSEALTHPASASLLRAALIAGFGPSPTTSTINAGDVAAALGVHPNTVRSWLRRAENPDAAAAALMDALAAAHPAAPQNPGQASGGIDFDAAAAALGLRPESVRRWTVRAPAAQRARSYLHGLLHTVVDTDQNRAGGVNVAAAAAALDVSEATIRRWLRTPDDAGHPALPASHLEQLLTLIRPTARTRLQDEMDADQAHKALDRLNLGRGGGGMIGQYDATGWLEPHLVMILDVPGTGLRRATVTRANARLTTRARRGGDVVDFTSALPTRWHAVLARLRLLRLVDGWRVQAAPGIVVPRGHQKLWVAAAPLPAALNAALNESLDDISAVMPAAAN
jgi:transposase-like protein